MNKELRNDLINTMIGLGLICLVAITMLVGLIALF